MSGGQVSSSVLVGNVPSQWSVALTGDYDGNGMSDVMWRDTSGNIAVWFMNGALVVSATPVGVVSTAWTIQSAGAE
jgi:hypothetical protein